MWKACYLGTPLNLIIIINSMYCHLSAPFEMITVSLLFVVIKLLCFMFYGNSLVSYRTNAFKFDWLGFLGYYMRDHNFFYFIRYAKTACYHVGVFTTSLFHKLHKNIHFRGGGEYQFQLFNCSTFWRNKVKRHFQVFILKLSNQSFKP